MRYILYYAIDFLKLYVIETGIFGYKAKKDFKAPITALIFTALYILMYNLTKDHLRLQALSELIYLLTNIITISIAMEGRKRFLISFASLLCLSLLDDSFILAAANITGRPYSELNDDFITHCFLMLISLGIYTLITRFILYLRRKNGENNVDLKESEDLYFWILGISVMGVYVIGIIQKNTFLSLGIGIIVAVLMAIIIQNSASKKYYENISRVNEKIKDSQKAYYEEMLLRENETRKFRHDINNHVLCLKTLLDDGKYDEARDYLSGIENKTKSLRLSISTGNDLVNAITSDMMTRYENVKLNWEGHLPTEMTISDMDICVIFSNILDNAFDAASKCDTGNVRVRISAAGASLMITVINNIAEPIQLKASKLVTSKPNKHNHGFGVINVKECAAKNGGNADFVFDEKQFTVEIILPGAVNV